MNATNTPRNRHPVDLLAEARAEIRELQRMEAELREEISRLMGDADSLGGDEYIARQTLSTRKGSIDPKMMEADGLDPDDYRKPSSVVMTLAVEPRVAENG